MDFSIASFLLGALAGVIGCLCLVAGTTIGVLTISITENREKNS